MRMGFNTVDLARNTGTVNVGQVFIPKPKGVKRGWMKQFGAISGNRFFLFNISENKNQLISLIPSHFIDLKDRNFAAEKAQQQVNKYFHHFVSNSVLKYFTKFNFCEQK